MEGHFQGNKESPLEPAHFPQRPDIWNTVGSWRRGSQGRLTESGRTNTHPELCCPLNPTTKGSTQHLLNGCFLKVLHPSHFGIFCIFTILSSHLPALSQHLLLQILPPASPKAPQCPSLFSLKRSIGTTRT